MQDVNSHGRVVDSVLEKAQTLLHSSQNSEVSQFINDIKSKYQSLQNMAKDSIVRSETRVRDHTLYTESFSSTCDWLRLMTDRLSMCSDLSGDKHSVTNKLDRVQVIKQACKECKRNRLLIIKFLIIKHLSSREK